jgi:glycine/D-amino acid oxidase-like deaminating enzyme
VRQGLGVLLALGMIASSVWSQDIQLGGDRAAETHKDHVSFAADAIVVAAGKPQIVELRFQVDPGFHINSHTPKDELLIPTALKLDAASVKVVSEDYPQGSSFRLTIGDGETLDVYQGEFRVKLRVVAPRGVSTLSGTLHYQACDNAACFPPRNLPVKVAVTGK